MKNLPIILIALAVLAALGCQRKASPVADNGLTFSVSTICGWCAGGDSLTITAQQSVYRHYKSCDQSAAAEKTMATDKEQWGELVALLNPEKFRNIHLNICNVCADGCDIRATVKGRDYVHSISYGNSSNEAVADIRPLLQKLEAIRLGYEKTYGQ